MDLAEYYLGLLGNNTGLVWGPIAFRHEKYFWFRPPRLHIIEWIVFHIFAWIFYRFSRGYHTAIISKCNRELCTPVARGEDARTRTLERCLGMLFVVCLVGQLVAKGGRDDPFVELWWCLMPCHLITGLWAYALLVRRDHITAGAKVYLGLLAITYHWGPVAATITPDFHDHIVPVLELPFALPDAARVMAVVPPHDV